MRTEEQTAPRKGIYGAASPASASSAMFTMPAFSCTRLPAGAARLGAGTALLAVVLDAAALELCVVLEEVGAADELLGALHALEEEELHTELVLCALLDVLDVLGGGGGGGGGGVEVVCGFSVVFGGGGGGGGVGVGDGAGSSPPPTVQVAPQARSSKKPKKLAMPGVQSRPSHGQPGHLSTMVAWAVLPPYEMVMGVPHMCPGVESNCPEFSATIKSLFWWNPPQATWFPVSG